MDEIPEDIRRAAETAFLLDCLVKDTMLDRFFETPEAIARAIWAERKRSETRMVPCRLCLQASVAQLDRA